MIILVRNWYYDFTTPGTGDYSCHNLTSINSLQKKLLDLRNMVSTHILL
jgi:hypothetical protein